jgi:hypothetical protein
MSATAKTVRAAASARFFVFSILFFTLICIGFGLVRGFADMFVKRFGETVSGCCFLVFGAICLNRRIITVLLCGAE